MAKTTRDDGAMTTPYSGNTTLGKVGVGNYGTTAEQLDTSGSSPYTEGGEESQPSQWQINSGDLATFVGLSGAK